MSRSKSPSSRTPTAAGASGSPDVTTLLYAWRDGDEEALEHLMPMVYRELRLLAGRQMRGEHGARTLQPTGLVNEAFLRLVQMDVDWKCRAHFFAVAGRQMRRILLDVARKKSRLKRGSAPPESLDQMLSEPASPVDGLALLELDLAMEALEKSDERKARIVEMRIFAGLSIDETSEVLKVSTATVERELAFARAWLSRRLKPSS